MQEPVAEGEYVIEAVLAHREVKVRGVSVTEYLVKWLDGSETCEPEEN